MSKYGKPVWQYVFEAAKTLKTQTFSAADIVDRVHQTNPAIPAVTIQSYVIAMAPNHPFSGHWPSTRRLHGVFDYLGDGRFQIKEEGKAGKTVEPKRRLWYCKQCGYVTYREKPPQVCPICKAKTEMFEETKTELVFRG
ncbi:MAG: rubredoxin-like domain-containing protein [Candidatus Bathyarchaeia archaeon]|jgi:rubredoxin